MKKTLLPLLLAALMLAHGTAGAWGFFGHRTITQVAVYELPAAMQAFYYRHMAELVRQSTAPDERRNDDPTEAPKHFIDMDHYSEENPFGKVPKQYDKAVEKFSADTLKKYGTVPWVVLETKNNLTEAFRQRDTLAIIKYSAELSHYVGDAFVPLHTTINYDGQLTDQKGLHSLWESQLPERFIADYKLNGEPAKYVKNPLDAIWGVLQQSYGFLGETFDRATKIEKTMKPDVRFTFSHRYGKTTRRYSDAFADAYEKEVGGMVDFRLKGAPNMVSSLWLTAWEDGGKPNLNELMHPPKLTKEEKEKLATELTAWKKNTLGQDQLLLAQQKAKKVEVVDEIKPAKDMGQAPAPAAEAAPVPASPDTVPVSADKIKVKVKGKDGTEKIKQKAEGPQ
ncbi:zinc dependent phospholipase C family protein [Hymenobacter sp. BT770]|uniref:zinc dependent phospholipase C family protein n=1 Tax=Hymenobacter sp. BT770 TaxID=2886942 RepID=UPI001D12F0AB|nr:zinc dependent phospholipase C family protein [Hymenobacter sp. BT770]MCC3151985.1 zinc dependent phospholipase C family protein [Hymenobacter sp. BT770]MDO3417095.1 zinc dependent phospholipase C family protein [Hymenobacter sp. BT770]